MTKLNVKYDADIIREFAEDLYKQAETAVANGSWSGSLIGGCFALPGVLFFSGAGFLFLFFMISIPITAGGWIGYSIGKRNAFKYKLEAQTALAQVQIERNTRTASRQLAE